MWVPYFTVDSAATAAETVEPMGGSVQFGPVQIAEPRPDGAKKLAGSDRDWCIRFGQYRIVCEINDDQNTLTIFTVAKTQRRIP